MTKARATIAASFAGVVRFDDIPAASLTTPPLTTVMQDIKGAGEALVDALLAQIEGREIPPNKLPGKLVTRGSTAPV